MADCKAVRVNDSKLIIEEDLNDTTLIPCSICQRTFKSESLQKHQGVCMKNATKKRKVFDSMKQRIQGTELAEYIPIPVVVPKPKLILTNKVVMDKAGRDANSPPELPHLGNDVKHASIHSDKHQVSSRSRGSHLRGAFKEERCPHCDRTFSWKAFSRHEEWCKEHKSRIAQSPAAVLKAKEMLDARKKYRAPALGKVKRPTNREKYAGGAHLSPGVDVSPNMESNSRSSHMMPRTLAPSESKRSAVSSTVSSSFVPAVKGTNHQVVLSLAESTPVRSKKFNSVHHHPFREGSTDEIQAETPLAKHSSDQSMYDPFCKAKMQLKELLSDEICLNEPILETSYPVHSSENGTHVHPDYVLSRNNGNIHGILEIHSNQKQAKEIELPDMFTETSTQLSFEMPNLMCGRDVSLHTKRRSMKPTAQTMGIELKPVKDGFVEKGPTSKISGPNMRNHGDQDCDSTSSFMEDMGLRITQDKNMKLNPDQELDISNIHESINIVALELANLSTNSSESLFDMDNNNCSLEMNVREEMDAVDSLRDSLENEERNLNTAEELNEVGKMVCSERRQEGNCWRSLSPETLVGVSGKHLVDSAYNSLSRTALPTMPKEAVDPKFIHLAHSGGDDNLALKRRGGQDDDFKLAKFCHDCGSRYPLTEAKFCCACGARRLVL